MYLVSVEAMFFEIWETCNISSFYRGIWDNGTSNN